jgi:hypothetical protein
MQLSTKALTLLLSSIPLISLIAADCSVYVNSDTANQDNQWYDEKPLTKVNDNLYTWTTNYHGHPYTFTVKPSIKVDGTEGYSDSIKVESQYGDDRQFKIKLKEENGGIMTAYWSSKGADCSHPTRYLASMIKSVYVSERCYSACPEYLESP